MKLIHTLTALSILGLTSFASAGDKCNKSGDKMVKKAGKCDVEKCDTDCDMDKANMATFVVTGMTCGSCSNKVKTTLAKVDGVTVKSVCHKSGKVMVKYDAAKTDKSKVSEAITSTGFKVTGEKLTIPVSGMTCGGCSGKVSKALAAIDGCSEVGVCHKSGHASVVIDTAKTSEAKVMEAIKATGFKAGAEAKAPATETTKVKG